MIRLNSVFTLEDDILQKVNIEGGWKKSNEKQVDESLDEVTIVGLERDGVILISRKTKDSFTFIDMYEPKSKKVTTVYKHPGRIQVTSATVNEERTILVFTVKRHNSVSEEIYDSYIREIGPNPDYITFSNTVEIQRAQFLYSDQDAQNTNQKKSSYILFFVKDTVSICQIAYKNRPEGGVKLNGNATMKSNVLKNILWYEWEARKGILTCLTTRPSKNSSAPVEPILKSMTFTEKKYNLFDKDEKEASVLFEIPLLIKLPSGSSGYNLNACFSPYRVQENTIGGEHLHIVNMRGPAFCLCHQHAITAQSSTVDVSVYLLHHRVKIDLSIPLRDVDAATWSKIRVVFDTIADMLLIYIPGYHFQLIDCSDDHPPTASLTLSGSEFAPPSPLAGSLLVPIDFLSKTDYGQGPDLRGHTLLDHLTGHIYEYTIDREVILKLFDLQAPELQHQALHLAMIHMQDTELVAKIMTHTFAYSPQNTTPTLLSEFLIGTIYAETLKKMKSITDCAMERFLPISSTDLNLDSILGLSKRIFSNIKVFIMSGYNHIPGTKIQIKDREEEKRFLLTVSQVKRAQAPYSPVSANPPPGVRRFFRDLLGLDDEYGKILKQTESDRSPDESEVEAISRRLFVDSMSMHLSYYFPKEKSSCHSLAGLYYKVQGTQVNQLFKYILYSNTPGTATQFRIMEHFYAAIEELAFPYPKGFYLEFAKLGFRCLRRNVFLQYVDRGVFVLDEDFVKEVCRALAYSTNQEDYDFKFHLISRLEQKHQCADIMKNLPETYEFLSQYLLSSLPTKSLQSILGAANNGYFDMESADNSPFIPLSVLMNTLKAEDTYVVDVPFIDDASKKLISGLFGVSFDDAASKSDK